MPTISDGLSGEFLFVLLQVVAELVVAEAQASRGGRLVAMSTPFGKRGWWFQEWAEGGPTWGRVLVTAKECPRITAEFLEEERRHLGQWWYRQEYFCEFQDAQTAAFTWEMLQAAVSEERTLSRLLEDLLHRAFEGSASALVAHLLDRSSPSAEELKKIHELIDRYNRQ